MKKNSLPWKVTLLSSLVTMAISTGPAQSRPTLTALLDTANSIMPGNLEGVQKPVDLPLPAGATLEDIDDSGQYVLFSSTDPNLVADGTTQETGQETIPLHPNLFWMDLSQGVEKRVIRLVTHYAGSTRASAGFSGVGNGLVAPFEPLSADLSSDGKTVVFDSRIAANDYDATVPKENDQPNLATFFDLWTQEPEVPGTVDVFTWNADAIDPANNITLVSLLNATGKANAVEFNPNGNDLPPPDVSAPMAAGIFNEYSPVRNYEEFFATLFTRPYEYQLFTENRGISQDGKRVLYTSMVPAPWLDTRNSSIKDALPLKVIDVAPYEQTADGFLVQHTPAAGGGAAALEQSMLAHDGTDNTPFTITATLDKEGNALGYYMNALMSPTGFFLLNEFFEAEFLQLSSNGDRVVYSTRQIASNLIDGVQDSDFSQDVFAFDVNSRSNLLVSRQYDDPLTAAGNAQAPYNLEAYLYGGTIEFYDSTNYSVSSDGSKVALVSSAGNLVQGMQDNNAEMSERAVWFPDSGVRIQTIQAKPYDIFVNDIANVADTVIGNASTSVTSLVNTPDGITNTNLLATLSGMSSDGNVVLFATTANNFYDPKFADGHYPANWAQGDKPKNFLLGGFSNLWARDIAKKTTTLVSVGADGKSSGNQATLGSPAAPGGRDVLANISEHGRFVLFSSSSSNLVKGVNDKAYKGGIFLRDMKEDPVTKTGKTTLMSTTATGNAPSAGRYLNSAISSNGDELGTARVFMDGTGGHDMQTTFRQEEIAPLISHIYTIDYPRLTWASSTQNPALFSVAAENSANSILERRGNTRVVKASPGKLFRNVTDPARVAMGDVNGDGTVDYIYGASEGNEPEVVVIDGKTSSQIMRFDAFPPSYRNGVYVAAADINNDGYADIITGIGSGVSLLTAKNTATVNIFTGRYGYLIASMIIPSAGKGGVRVAGGDVDGDGIAEVIVGSGKGVAKGGIQVFKGADIKAKIDAQKKAEDDLEAAGQLPDLAAMQPYTFTPQCTIAVKGTTSGKVANGVYVAAADLDSDGQVEIVASADNATSVNLYSYGNNTCTLDGSHSFSAEFPGVTGLRVAARAGRIMLGSGPSTSNFSLVKMFEYDRTALKFNKIEQFQPSYYNVKKGMTGSKKGVYVG